MITMFLASILSGASSTALAERQETLAGGIPLKIEGVSKTFSGRSRVVNALRPVDIDVAAGEFVCLLGPSGCGKSTLLSIIAGLETPSTGHVFANGAKIQGPGIAPVLLF